MPGERWGAGAGRVCEEWWRMHAAPCCSGAAAPKQKAHPPIAPPAAPPPHPQASHLLSKLDWPAAVEELKQAVAHLRGEGSRKVGCTGFWCAPRWGSLEP